MSCDLHVLMKNKDEKYDLQYTYSLYMHVCVVKIHVCKHVHMYDVYFCLNCCYRCTTHTESAIIITTFQYYNYFESVNCM